MLSFSKLKYFLYWNITLITNIAVLVFLVCHPHLLDSFSALFSSALCPKRLSNTSENYVITQTFLPSDICCIWPMDGTEKTEHGKREKFEYFFLLLFPFQAVVCLPEARALLDDPSQHSLKFSNSALSSLQV